MVPAIRAPLSSRALYANTAMLLFQLCCIKGFFEGRHSKKRFLNSVLAHLPHTHFHRLLFYHFSRHLVYHELPHLIIHDEKFKYACAPLETRIPANRTTFASI